MKHLISLRELVITLLLICCNAVWAYDIKVDGINYNITSATDFTAEVADCGDKLNLRDIVIPSTITYKSRTFTVTRIGEKAFFGSNVRSVKLPNSITSIKYGAFFGCKRLISIEIPSTVTSIESAAFYNCMLLESIKLPNSIRNIGDMMFAGCTYLRSVELPNSITSIEYGAFQNCRCLMKFVIPKSVTSIGNEVFKGSNNLTSIYVMTETPPRASGSSFEEIVFMEAVLYVPNGCLEAYKNAEVWKNFWDIREFDPTGIGDVKTENENATTVYDLNGRVVENPTNGIYIIDGKKVLLK